MARTIVTIQAQIWGQITGNPILAAKLTSSSTTAVWWVWSWCIATVQNIQEGLFDAFQAVVNAIIASLKPHTLQWYVTRTKAFQWGDTLPVDNDVYNPVRAAGDPAYIVSFAAAVELPNLIRIKVAGGTVGALTPLSAGQMTALRAYMSLVKDAGVRVQMTTAIGDDFKTGMIIYYDPLVLTATGARIDGTSATPVQDAINAFLNSLPFNGVFLFNSYVDALQAVSGVVVADVGICEANYGATPYINIITSTPNEYLPDAGYLVLNAGYFLANVVYLPYTG